MFKNRGSPCDILSSRDLKDQRHYKNWTKETVSVYILGLIFYGVSSAKTNLLNKTWFNFVFGSFFEPDHLLNLIILRVYAKRWPKCTSISKDVVQNLIYDFFSNFSYQKFVP